MVGLRTVMLSLRSILSLPANYSDYDKMFRKLSMTDV